MIKIILTILLLIATPAISATIYVDADISDCADYDPTTELCGAGSFQAYDTITEAETNASGGDTITVMAGDYSSERITITGIDGGGVGSETTFVVNTGDTAICGGFYIKNDNYIITDGFTIRPRKNGTNADLIEVENSDYVITRNHNFDIARKMVVDDVVIDGSAETITSATGGFTDDFESGATITVSDIDGSSDISAANDGALTITGLTDNIITTSKNMTTQTVTGDVWFGMTSSPIFYDDTSDNGTISGNTIGSSTEGPGDAGIFLYNNNNHTVSGNTIQKTGYDAILAYGHDHLITGNSFFDIGDDNDPGHADIVQSYCNASDCYNITFEKNKVIGGSAQLMHISVGTSAETQTDHWVIRNNIFIDVYAPMYFYVDDVEISNNTFLNCSEIYGAMIVFDGPTYFSTADPATYMWTQSTADSDDYYLTTVGGGDAGIANPPDVAVAGTVYTRNTGGNLAVGEWEYGDNDTLGFNAIYVRMADDQAPADDEVGYNSKGIGRNGIIKNNILIGGNGADDGGYSCHTDFPCTTDYNHVAQRSADSFAAKSWYAETNGIDGGDPKFTDISDADSENWNVTLQSDSPCIDVGVDLSGDFTDDYAGNTRPVNGGTSLDFDIGAMEYIETATMRGVSINN